MADAVSGIAKAAGSATPWGAIATGFGALVNLGTAVFNTRKRNKLQKEWDKVYSQRPTYEISQGYKDALGTYQRLASGGLPGQNIIEQNIQDASARAITSAERGAISSTAYGGQVSNIYDKELQAIQDLGIRAAEYETEQQARLAAGQEMMGVQQEKAQDWNKLGAWSTKLNTIESKMGGYAQNASAGWQGFNANLQDFAGTQYYNQMLKNQNPQQGVPIGGNISKPVQQFNQPNLVNTVNSAYGRPDINWSWGVKNNE